MKPVKRRLSSREERTLSDKASSPAVHLLSSPHTNQVHFLKYNPPAAVPALQPPPVPAASGSPAVPPRCCAPAALPRPAARHTVCAAALLPCKCSRGHAPLPPAGARPATTGGNRNTQVATKQKRHLVCRQRPVHRPYSINSLQHQHSSAPRAAPRAVVPRPQHVPP